MKTKAPFTIHLSLTVPDQVDEAIVVPKDNGRFEVWFDNGLLAIAARTNEGWIDENPEKCCKTPDFIEICRLIDERYTKMGSPITV